MTKRSLLGLIVLLAGWRTTPSVAADDLAAGFANPPDAAKPWAYWWWLDSYATREGITRDLEEMKRQGIAGVLLFDAGEGGPDAPKGPLFMSPAWRELFKHALREADRLGIVVGVNICGGWNAGGTWVTPDHAAKRLVWSSVDVIAGSYGEIVKDLPRPEARDNYYRDIAVVALPGFSRHTSIPSLKNWEVKAARVYLTQPPETLYEEFPEKPDDSDYPAAGVIDVTKNMDANGRLTWAAPEGTWTVLRFGYTLLGAKTSCTSPGSKGYEIDFLSARALDMHWAETGAKMFADAGPLLGKTLKYVHDDSYEVTNPFPAQLTWTPEFRAEFRARRGYDLLAYLPVLTGSIANSRAVSNRFLWDYRRTIADLFADGHYRHLRDLAQKHGVGTHPESGGPFWPCIDALQTEGINDVPMGEFWKRVPEQPDGKIMWSDTANYAICDTVRQAASAAHIYGKPICQAEAFTSMGPNWEEDFYDLKDVGDRAFCAGLTRNVLCFYVHQGSLDAKPGYEWEAAGTHFDRNVTWWNQSHAWLKYLARCQYMLQQGRFVADLLYFYGEDAPNYVPAKTHMHPPLPAGYDCDTTNADVLLNRLSVKDGRLTLPDGMSYRLLVLPERRAMSLAVLRKIKELVEAGATAVGPKPERTPGLTGYPQCDADVKRLADELWGDVDGKQLKERKVGQGRIIDGKPLEDILAADGIGPDFTYGNGIKSDKLPAGTLDFIHRSTGDAEVYFISNQTSQPQDAICGFRGEKTAQTWDPVTGERWHEATWGSPGRTAVGLTFASRQSWFVVLGAGAGYGGTKSHDRASPQKGGYGHVAPTELSGPWTVKFDPKWGGPPSVVFQQLEDWTKRPEPGIRYYSGKAVYEKTFDLPGPLRGSGQRIYLDLGRIKNVAEVRLNGKDLGVIWTAPWHVEITGAVQPTGNRLEIAVVNLWPNRLIGDAGLPPEKRLTATNVKKFKKDSPLLESGLLGPVTLRTPE